MITTKLTMLYIKTMITRSLAIAGGPHNAVCQLKSCHLLRRCTENPI